MGLVQSGKHVGEVVVAVGGTHVEADRLGRQDDGINGVTSVKEEVGEDQQ